MLNDLNARFDEIAKTIEMGLKRIGIEPTRPAPLDPDASLSALLENSSVRDEQRRRIESGFVYAKEAATLIALQRGMSIGAASKLSERLREALKSGELVARDYETGTSERGEDAISFPIEVEKLNLWLAADGNPYRLNLPGRDAQPQAPENAAQAPQSAQQAPEAQSQAAEVASTPREGYTKAAVKKEMERHYDGDLSTAFGHSYFKDCKDADGLYCLDKVEKEIRRRGKWVDRPDAKAPGTLLGNLDWHRGGDNLIDSDPAD